MCLFLQLFNNAVAAVELLWYKMKEKRMSMNDKMEGKDIKELLLDASTMNLPGEKKENHDMCQQDSQS
jgi:hypothetical protein